MLRLTGALSPAPLVRFGYFGLFLAGLGITRGLAFNGLNCHQLAGRR